MAVKQEMHPPFHDTFLVPALVTAVARLSADAATALPDVTALEAEGDAVYGPGIGALLCEAPTWLEALRTLPDGCACCDPAYTPVYEQFERAADIAGRLVGDGLLQRLFGAAPVSAPQWADALKKWLTRTDASVALAALVTSATLDLAVPPDRRRAPAADKLYQAFDRLLKTRGISTWPDVVRGVDEGWQAAPVAWTLLFAAEDSVNAFDSALRTAEEHEAAAKAEAEQSAKAAVKAADDAAQARAMQTTEAALRVADARIRELEDALAHARRDAAEARLKASRTQTALERLTTPDEPDEPTSAAPAVVPPPPPPPEPEPEDPFPLRGERVYLFTNQEREGVRAEQAAALEALGAQVTVYFNKSLRTRAPDAFPPEVIVVSDVAFAPHAKTDEIKKRAKKSGVRFYEGKLGTGSIGRTVAEFVKQQRAKT
jgi:hypothetical protein